MPIHRLLESSGFGSVHFAAMVQAFETAVQELTLKDGANRVSDEAIAVAIIDFAQTGERDASIFAAKTIARLHR